TPSPTLPAPAALAIANAATSETVPADSIVLHDVPGTPGVRIGEPVPATISASAVSVTACPSSRLTPTATARPAAAPVAECRPAPESRRAIQSSVRYVRLAPATINPTAIATGRPHRFSTDERRCAASTRIRPTASAAAAIAAADRRAR